MITKLWYSIHSGGDGSAYSVLMESEALCIIDQKYLEDWAEECYGCFIIESDGPIHIRDEIETVVSQIAEIEKDLAEDYMQEYDRTGQYPEWLAALKNKLIDLRGI